MAPLLILLLLGIVEFGWGIAQQLDLRHKAREVLRLAVVDGTDAEIINRVCSDDIIANDAIVRIQSLASGSQPGDTAGVIIEADLTQITGFFTWAWGGAVTLESEVYGRVEQPTTQFTPGESLTCP
jgi:Flp pilus assembly protein TadG